MDPHLKTSGKAVSDVALATLPSPKPDTSFVPRMLTPSEIESLRRDLRESVADFRRMTQEEDARPS